MNRKYRNVNTNEIVTVIDIISVPDGKTGTTVYVYKDENDKESRWQTKEFLENNVPVEENEDAPPSD